jgi:hypothetical protein
MTLKKTWDSAKSEIEHLRHVISDARDEIGDLYRRCVMMQHVIDACTAVLRKFRCEVCNHDLGTCVELESGDIMCDACSIGKNIRLYPECEHIRVVNRWNRKHEH